MRIDLDDPERFEPHPDVAHIVLLGLMGAGKTTVGRLLAERLDWRFVDTDEVIQAETGRTIRELWDEGGEAAYRPLEAKAVIDSLAATQRSIIAAPGGVADDDAAALALQTADAAVVYLCASVPTLVDRVGRDPQHRPLIDDRPEELLATMFARRDQRYSDLAQLVVDVDDLAPEEVVEQVLSGLVGVAFRPG